MNRTFVLVLLAIFLSISGSLNAQNSSLNYSVSPGFGLFASLEDDDQLGFIGGLEASILTHEWVASTHYYCGYELNFYDDPPRYFHQTALLFGRSKSFSSFRLKYQAGIAAIWGIRYTEYYSDGWYSGHYLTESYEKPGLVLEVGMDYLASRYFGLGTQLNVNLNTELPMIQVAMCLSFGKLK